MFRRTQWGCIIFCRRQILSREKWRLSCHARRLWNPLVRRSILLLHKRTSKLLCYSQHAFCFELVTKKSTRGHDTKILSNELVDHGKKAKYTVTFYHSVWTSRLCIISSSISAYPHIRSGSPPRSISKLYIFINFIGYLSATTSQLFCIAALHSHVRRTGLPWGNIFAVWKCTHHIDIAYSTICLPPHNVSFKNLAIFCAT